MKRDKNGRFKKNPKFEIEFPSPQSIFKYLFILIILLPCLKKAFNFLMKVVIDVKAISVGRYKNGDSKKVWRRVNRPIKETEKI